MGTGVQKEREDDSPPGIRNWLAGRSGQLAAWAWREMNAGSVIRIAHDDVALNWGIG